MHTGQKIRIAIIVALLLFLTSSRSEETLSIPEFQRDLALVFAKATKVEQDGQWTLGTFEVTHVYAGVIAKVGNVFTVVGSEGPDAIGRSVRPVPAVGETGIWIVKRNGAKLYSMKGFQDYQFAFPARVGISRRFDEERELADAVAAVWDAQVDDQLSLLRQFASSKTPEISIWAIHSLGFCSPNDILEMSRHSGSSCIGGQVAIDDAMQRIKRDEWIHSPDRGQILQRWAGCAPDEYDQQLITQRLNTAWQETSVDDQSLFAAMAKVALNANFDLERRRFVVQGLGRRAVRDGKHSLAARALADLSKTLNNSVLREEASAWLDRAK